MEPEVNLENVEGDIVGSIVKANKDHQIPEKVKNNRLHIYVELI